MSKDRTLTVGPHTSGRPESASSSQSHIINACVVDEAHLKHYESAPDLHGSSDNVTIRKKPKGDSANMEYISSFMKDMFREFTKQQDLRFCELLNSMSTISEQNLELTKNVEMLSFKYDDFISKISILEKEREKDKKIICQLEEKVELLERKSRATGIEIRNIPKIDGENKENLSNLVINLGKTINVQIEKHAIKDIYRTKSKDASNPVIVEMASVIVKDNILKGVKNFNKTKPKGDKLNTTHLNPHYPAKPIYFSETLSQKAQRLFYLARSFQKNHGYTFCWTANGIIYLRKNENTSQIRVSSESDLDKLRNDL